jgi:hypothetical protein
VFIKRSKMNKIAIQKERRHPVADLFSRLWGSLSNRRADLQENGLNRPGLCGDVLVDRLEFSFDHVGRCPASGIASSFGMVSRFNFVIQVFVIQSQSKNGQHEAGRHDLDGTGLHIFDAVDEGLQLSAAAGVSQLAERSAGE